jgi:hypothetical protein
LWRVYHGGRGQTILNVVHPVVFYNNAISTEESLKHNSDIILNTLLGVTALQTGRSRVRFPMVSLDLFHFCQRLSRPQGHSATGRSRSIEKSNYTIGNQTRDLPVCSAVPQPLRHRVPPSVDISLVQLLFISFA